MGRGFVISANLIPSLGLLAIGACGPNAGWQPDDAGAVLEAEPVGSDPTGLAGFPSGIWVDGDNTVWSVFINGRDLRATAECGPSEGLELLGTVQKNFISYSVIGEGEPSVGDGRAMLVDGSHAYFIVNGEMRSHGLFHFNHVESQTACSARFAHLLSREQDRRR